ncbi:STS14 protein [Macadamia integrifolia]|uniref:STS14 protein n=1 Tax=Macadamia integrifolia TaxID=60698 RepID=UPI001C4F530D|nr:STS14 protein [Macadamia integrifolia]
MALKMQSCPLSLLFLLAITALMKVIAMPSTGSGTVPHYKLNASEEFLEEHNQARAAVGVPPLQWSPSLATLTSRLVRYQRNKKGCGFAVLSHRGKYGANQLWASGFVVTPRAAVQAWVKEKDYYNYTNNSCAPHHRCGVYKQVVWRKSLKVGCAQAVCEEGGHVTLTICFYSPPGNVIGQSPY